MKPYYQLKAYLTHGYMPLGEIVTHTLCNMQDAGEQELRITTHQLVYKFAPRKVAHNYSLLDAPSRKQLRTALAEELPNFCVKNGYILRQIKVSASGMLISVWMTKP